MHEKYANQGLVVVSVSTDEIDEDRPAAQVKDNVRKFLKNMKAPFPCLILDEPAEFRSEKLHFDLSPCAFVFNRQGKWIQFNVDPNPFDADKIEKQVVRFLQER